MEMIENTDKLKIKKKHLLRFECLRKKYYLKVFRKLMA